MTRIKNWGFGFLFSLITGLMLVACGDNTPTPVTPPTIAASPAAAKVITEKDGDTTLQLKVGQTMLAEFDQNLTWNFAFEPAPNNNATPVVLALSPDKVAAPYQAKFEAQHPGTATIVAQGACKQEPGKICNKAIFLYNISVTVS